MRVEAKAPSYNPADLEVYAGSGVL